MQNPAVLYYRLLETAPQKPGARIVLPLAPSRKLRMTAVGVSDIPVNPLGKGGDLAPVIHLSPKSWYIGAMLHRFATFMVPSA